MISGCIGPHDDGYDPEVMLDAEAAQEYHSTQIGTFADTGGRHGHRDHDDLSRRGDRSRPRRDRGGMPAAISFTVETDGRLPNGRGSARRSRRSKPQTDARPPTT